MKRYFVQSRMSTPPGSTKSHRIFEVIDRQSGKVTFDSASEIAAYQRAAKFNIQHAAIPGGFNPHRKG